LEFQGETALRIGRSGSSATIRSVPRFWSLIGAVSHDCCSFRLWAGRPFGKGWDRRRIDLEQPCHPWSAGLVPLAKFAV